MRAGFEHRAESRSREPFPSTAPRAGFESRFRAPIPSTDYAYITITLNRRESQMKIISCRNNYIEVEFSEICAGRSKEIHHLKALSGDFTFACVGLPARGGLPVRGSLHARGSSDIGAHGSLRGFGMGFLEVCVGRNKEIHLLSGRPTGVCMRKRQKWTIFSVVEVCRGISR